MGTRNGLRGLSGHSMVLVISDGGMGGFIQTGDRGCPVTREGGKDSL